MNTTVRNARLLKLAAFLRTLPRDRFYYGSWVGTDWKGSQDLSCGTTACALGWAATMPEFRRLGLRLHKEGFVVLARQRVDHDSLYTSLQAASKVFGVTNFEAQKLFLPDFDEAYATPKQVARKIERFVKRT